MTPLEKRASEHVGPDHVNQSIPPRALRIGDYVAGALAERSRAVGAVTDLFFALREIGGTPTLKDLVKLARRIDET